MKDRCSNSKNPKYQFYGGRGITVCERWRDSFAAFIEDMGRRPNQIPRLSLDRINNDRGYSKDNCRWTTHSEQMCNTRLRSSKRIVKYGSESGSLAWWAKRTGLKRRTIYLRIKRGWSIGEALEFDIRGDAASY